MDLWEGAVKEAGQILWNQNKQTKKITEEDSDRNRGRTSSVLDSVWVSPYYHFLSAGAHSAFITALRPFIGPTVLFTAAVSYVTNAFFANALPTTIPLGDTRWR